MTIHEAPGHPGGELGKNGQDHSPDTTGCDVMPGMF